MTDDSPAIPAATLIVLRDRRDGPAPDVLVVERAATMAFAGGAIVFPGGRVDAEDRDLARQLGRDEDAHRVTAIRETLEESAVAVGLGSVDPARGADMQAALVAGEPFARLLEREGLDLQLDALVPFARWRPSFHQARRFDTMFFVAAAPRGEWTPLAQAGECTAAEWAPAADLLQRVADGTAGAIFPTVRNLERLARFGSLDEAVADARLHPIEPIVPWIEEREGTRHVCIPADRGYPITSEPMTSAIRA